MTSPVPLLVSRDLAARMLGIGSTYFARLVDNGTIGPLPVTLGKRRLFSVRELQEWEQAGMPPRKEWLRARAAGKKTCAGACGCQTGGCPADTGSESGES